MRSLPDNYFDLCIADPPYGIGFSSYNRTNKTSDGMRYKANKYADKSWDLSIPSNALFAEMKRVSKNQIIWGGNYFPVLWEQGCKGFIFWDKKQPVDNFSAGELAWSSFDKPAKAFRYAYYGNINSEKIRIHPTQKPVALYAWLLDNYGNGGVKYSTLFWGVEAVELQHTRKASISMLANLTKIISKHKKNASEQSVWGRISKRMVV